MLLVARRRSVDIFQNKLLSYRRSNVLTRAESALGGFRAGAVADVHLAGRRGIVASVADGRRISIVRVDTGQWASVAGFDTIDVDVALALRAALLAHDIGNGTACRSRLRRS